MITIKNVLTPDGKVGDHTINSTTEYTIDAHGKLLLFPALIDSHLLFCSMLSDQLDYILDQALKGGITTLIATLDPTSKEGFEKRTEEINKHIMSLKKPVTCFFNICIDETSDIEKMIIQSANKKGIVLKFTEGQPPISEASWDKIFQAAAFRDLPISINLCNENSSYQCSGAWGESLLEKAIHYAERTNARLYTLNISSQKEIEIIKKGQKKGIIIYCSTHPEELFLNSNSDHLWAAIKDGTIETLGSGFLSHENLKEKFSELTLLLPLLMNAYLEKKITLENIVRLTRANIQDIFSIENNNDWVLVDLEKEHKIPWNEMSVRGWPVFTIAQGKVFNLEVL